MVSVMLHIRHGAWRSYKTMVIIQNGSLHYLFLFAMLLTNIIIILITIMTVHELFSPTKITAYIVSILVLTIDPFNLGGGGWLVDIYFKPAFFVRAFTYTALYFAIKKQPIISIIFICIGSLIHPTIALESFIISFMILILDKIYDLNQIGKFSISTLLKSSSRHIIAVSLLIGCPNVKLPSTNCSICDICIVGIL